MRILTYNNYNPDWKNKVNPVDIIKINFATINQTLKSLAVIKPELLASYIQAIKKRLLKEELQNYHFALQVFDLQELCADFPALKKHQELQELIVKITSKYLNLTPNYQLGSDPIERLEINIAKAQSIVQYHRTKAFADLLGREEGIKLWKELVAHFVDEHLKANPESRKGPMKAFIDKRLEINSWDEGGNSTLVIFDDYKLLEKIDRCMCHESFKHLNDPEFAYLSYCYIGDVADRRCKGIRRFRRRRTQILYFDDFCDEFFWDDEVYPDAKQPSLEFMRKLGKEDPTKIIEEFQNKK